MALATFDIEFPELRETLTTESDLTARLVDVRTVGDGPATVVLGFAGATGKPLGTILSEDPTVTEASRLADGGDQSLFNLTFDTGALVDVLSGTIRDLDGAVFDATGTDGVWSVDVFVPTRSALSTFYSRCRELDLEPTCRSVTVDDDLPTETAELTPAQRETLVAAVRAGYFAVPRESSLVELADTLGISDQAVSERLRRGTSALVAATILDDADDRDTPV